MKLFVLVLDESVDRLIEDRIENFVIETSRPPKDLTDKKVLKFALKQRAPVLTRDQGDFVLLDSKMDHNGIMIDKRMRLRNRTLVARTVAQILQNYPGLLENEVVFLSSFCGQF